MNRLVCVPHRQQGLALIFSLVLLVVSSLLAVATLSGSRLSERAAGNVQQKAIAFEAAESAVEQGFVPSQVQAVLTTSSASVDASQAIEIAFINASLADDYDQTQKGPGGADKKSVDVEGVLTIQYCGETALLVGTDLTANLDDSTRKVGLLFDVNGVANIAGSAAVADHVRRGYLTGPATGRAGSCVSR